MQLPSLSCLLHSLSNHRSLSNLLLLFRQIRSLSSLPPPRTCKLMRSLSSQASLRSLSRLLKAPNLKIAAILRIGTSVIKLSNTRLQTMLCLMLLQAKSSNLKLASTLQSQNSFLHSKRRHSPNLSHQWFRLHLHHQSLRSSPGLQRKASLGRRLMKSKLLL